MADAVMTAGSELAVLIPEQWSAAWYDTLLASLPFASSIARAYEGEITGVGDTVNVTQFPEFSEADEYGEAQRVDADSITASQIQLVINKLVAKDFILTKQGMIQSLDAQMQLRDLAMYSIMKKMNSIIIATISPSASAPDHQIAYDSGTTLALADILEAKELLDDQNVGEFGRQMIVDSAQYNDLFNITGFTSRDFIPAGSPLTAGAIATPVLGFNVQWTTTAAAVSRFFHPSFMQLAVQQVPDVRVYDRGVDGYRGMRVNMDVMFGVKQFDDERVVEVS